MKTRSNVAARFVAIGLLYLSVAPASTDAQFERYELGRRLREFEVDWDRTVDARSKANASESLKSAVNAFFSLRLGDAGRAIIEARFALRVGGEPTEAERWAHSIAIKPESRLIDSHRPDLPMTLVAFYPTEAKPPERPKVEILLAGSRVEVPVGSLPMTVSFPIKGLASGDHAMVAEIRSGKTLLARVSETISIVDRRDERLAAVGKTIGGWPENPASMTADRESSRGLFGMLESMAAGRTLESDFPGHRMLEILEAQSLDADRSRPYLSKDRAGQFWVTVVTRSGRRVPTRVFVPEVAAMGKPLPIVVALHGAGGSENMFFESYGHGAIVDRCRERGWLLVAPRSTGFGGSPVLEVVEELAKVYPIDRDRVMLVGHSMGAAQAVASGCAEPARFAAVAALGGGGSIRPKPGLGALPFFVGVGSEDFALKGARALVDGLKRVKVENVTAREYPTIEHLAIVQVALGDVFRFFDTAASARPKP